MIVKRKFKHGIRYQVRVRDVAGNWLPARSFVRKADAKKYEGMLLEQRDMGTRAVDPLAKELSFDQFVAFWRQERTVSKGWQAQQDRFLRDYILPFLNYQKLTMVTPADVVKVIRHAEDLGRSPKTIREIYGLMRKIFNDAIEQYDLLETNPVKVRYKPRVPEIASDFLVPDDAWALLDHAKKSNDWAALPVWIMTLSALRVSEVQGLRWKAVHLEKDPYIRIIEIYNRNEKRLQLFPKQKTHGSAPIPKELKEFLEKVKAERNPRESDFVCLGVDGKMLSYDSIYGAVKRLCREASVREMTPHKLRHSATEIYQRAGANTEDLRRLLNHNSLASTKKYIHRTDERLNKLAKSVRNK